MCVCEFFLCRCGITGVCVCVCALVVRWSLVLQRRKGTLHVKCLMQPKSKQASKWCRGEGGREGGRRWGGERKGIPSSLHSVQPHSHRQGAVSMEEEEDKKKKDSSLAFIGTGKKANKQMYKGLSLIAPWF